MRLWLLRSASMQQFGFAYLTLPIPQIKLKGSAALLQHPAQDEDLLVFGEVLFPKLGDELVRHEKIHVVVLGVLPF